jgi:hypothetical protein
VNGLSYYDIRATNTPDGAMLTVTFRFPAGSGIPELEYFDPSQGKYVPATVVSVSAPIFLGSGLESITVVFNEGTFPKLTDLHGSVFTIVLTPAPLSQSTNISPALALADQPGSGLTVTRDVSFQGSGLTLGLTPSQAVSVGVARADLSGGGGDDLDNADPADLDAILNTLGFSPPAAEPTDQTPVVAPAPASPAKSTVIPAATGPGAALPVVRPADAVFAPAVHQSALVDPVDALFAAATEEPFSFQPQPSVLEPVTAATIDRPIAPSLLAVPLLGALATHPPVQSPNRPRRRLQSRQIG